MRRLVPQLSLILIPLIVLMIGFVAVMPVAAAASCSTAWDAVRDQPGTSIHLDSAGKRVIVDPCQDRSTPDQNQTIINFALPLGIGLDAPAPQLASGPILTFTIIAMPKAPPGFIPPVISPPPVI